MSTQAYRITTRRAIRDAELDRRLDDVGWGLFFVLVGAAWLLPPERVPDGAPLIAVGAVLLALGAVRRLRRLPVHPLSTALGVLALAGGVGEAAAAQLDVLPVFLVVVGAGLVLKPLLSRKT